MEAALESLKSLKPGEKPDYAQTAKKFSVDRSLLSKRHRGVIASYAEKVDNVRLLNTTQETRLVRYIDKLCVRGLPHTREMTRNFAAEVVGKEPGKNWVDRFIARHHIELIY